MNPITNFYLYSAVLNKLFSLVALYGGYHIVIGGNFNVNFGKTSSSLTLLAQILLHETCSCFKNGFKCHFKYESATGIKLFIDNFSVSQSINRSSSDLSVTYDVLSQRLPIQINTNISYFGSTQTPQSHALDWDKASPSQLKLL